MGEGMEKNSCVWGMSSLSEAAIVMWQKHNVCIEDLETKNEN